MINPKYGNIVSLIDLGTGELTDLPEDPSRIDPSEIEDCLDLLGVERALITTAQSSFNILVVAGLLGTVVGGVLCWWLRRCAERLPKPAA